MLTSFFLICSVAFVSSVFSQSEAIHLKWEFQTDAPVAAAPSIGTNGTVYAGSDSGKLYAISELGEEIWRFQSLSSIRVSPLVGFDGSVYLAPLDGNLYSLSSTGGLNWRFESTYDNTSFLPAETADGRIYAGFHNRFFAFSSSGQKLWEVPNPSYGLWPVIGADGTIYHTGENIVARASNGAPVWSFTLPRPKRFLPSPPPVAPNGTIYAFAEWGTDYSLHAIRSDGTEEWSFSSGEPFSGSAVIGADGIVYFGTQNGSIYSVRPDGELIWKKTIDGFGSVSPAVIDDGLLLIGMNSGRVIATTLTGDLLWSTNLPGQLTPAAVGTKGTIYVGSSASKVYAIGTSSRPLEGVWSVLQGNPQRTSRAPSSTDVPTAPTNVIASVGIYPARVAVTWQSSANALSYEVWRNSEDNLETAQMLQGGIKNRNYYFDDQASTNPSFYWVRAQNSVGASLYSLSALGFAATGGPTGSWQFTANGPIFYSSPALGRNGEVYIQSSGINVTSGAPASKGWLYALNNEGQRIWSAQTGEWGNSSPAVGEDGTIYVGAGFNSYTSSGIEGVMGYLYAYTPEGSLKWKYPSGAQFMNSPAIGEDGTIYIGSLDYHVHAISPTGERKWIFNTGGAVADSLAIAADGTIYSRAGHYLYAIDTNGVSKWQFHGGGAFSPPAIGADGTVYSGAGPDIMFGGPGQRTFYALNPDGSVQWSFELDTPATGGAAVGSDGSIYFGTRSGRFYALSRDGVMRWFFETGATILSSPAIRADGSICFGAQDGRFYIIKSNGALESRLFTDSAISSSPTIDANGRIYFGGEDRRIYAIAGSIPLASSAWPMFGRTPTHSFRDATDVVPAAVTNLLVVPSTNGIQLTWNAPEEMVTFEVFRADVNSLDAATRIAQFVRTNAYEDESAAAGTEFFYWIRPRNSYGLGGFSAVSSATRPLPPVGGVIWSYPTGPGRMILAAPAIATDGTIYVGTAQTNSEPLLEHYLYAFKTNGTLKWRAPVGGSLFSSPAVAEDGTIYIGSTDFGLYAFTPEGLQKWRFQGGFDPQRPFGNFNSSPAIAADGTIYVGATDNRLYAIDPDGTLKWSYATASASIVSPVNSSPAIASDGTIYAAAARQLFALRPNGDLVWTYRSTNNFDSSPALGNDGTIFIGNEDAHLHAVRPDGTVKWRFAAGAASKGSTPVIALDETIYFASPSSNFYAIDSNGLMEWKFRTDGALTTTPALGADGTIYFGSTDKNFYALNSNGTLHWKVDVGSAVVSPSIIGLHQTVFFGATDGRFFFIRGDTPLAESAWPVFHQNAQHTGLSQVPSGSPASPLGVIASDGSILGVARVQWESSDWAVSYEILRNTVPEVSSASIIASNISGTTIYDDHEAQFETRYYYWVRASNSKGTSDWSAYDLGYQDSKQWEYIMDSPVRSSPAIDAQGNIYLAEFGGKLVSLSHAGQLNWTFNPMSTIRSSASIAIDGTVYFGAEDGKLYAVGPTGIKKWEMTLSRPVVSPPSIGQDATIYATTIVDGKLYAISPTGQKLWELACRATGISPSIGADGTVYVPTLDRSVYAVGREGQVKWIFRGLGTITSSAAIAHDGTIYVGEDRRFSAINSDGSLKWGFATGARRVTGPPVIGPDHTVYFGTDNMRFYAVRPDGSLRWQTNLVGSVRSSPAISADYRIFVSTDQGTLYTLNQDGQILDRFAAGSFSDSSPAIDAAGTIYVGSVLNKLYALKIASPLANSPWPMLQRNPRHTGADDSLPFFVQPAISAEGAFVFRLTPGLLDTLILESSHDLDSWVVFTNLVNATNQTEIRDSRANGGKLFYRMRSP